MENKCIGSGTAVNTSSVCSVKSNFFTDRNFWGLFPPELRCHMCRISLFKAFLSVVLMFNILNTARRTLFTMASSNINESTPFSISYVTVPNDDVAKKLAEGLVKEKLAACVNIIPGIHSVYEWEGEIQKDAELLMVIKSRMSRLEELTKYVRENHPYQVCEVISTNIQHGNPPYLKWLGDIVPEK